MGTTINTRTIHDGHGPGTGAARRGRQLLATAVTLGAAFSLLVSCPGGPDTESGVPASREDAAQPGRTAAFPAAADREPGDISGNEMHKLHLAGGIECGDCHDPQYPMEHEQSIKSCDTCHDQTVVLPVWEHHCLTCHHFTYSDTEAANDPFKVGELCHDCHVGDEASETIYAFIHPDEQHQITCAYCHHPHDSEDVARPEYCTECHPELAGISHPSEGGVSCDKCHNPHLGGRSGADVCTTCHQPDNRVLVHLIPAHPDDCLVCHSPHFEGTQIRGDSCLECHDGMYYAGGKNQPDEHQDCKNCHWVSDFKYKGDEACIGCHTEMGWLTTNKHLPSQHRNCLTCHHPHIWRAPFSQNCVSCHDPDTVLEHRLSFHGEDCETCHDPHLTDEMPKSGNCRGCHGANIPEFLPDAADEHVECANCHGADSPEDPGFKFAGDAATCIKCHARPGAEHEHDWDDLPAEHKQCHVCHPAHTFPRIKDVADSCRTCHADMVRNTAIAEHRDCFNCHSHDHTVEFRGRSVTCVTCHSEAAAGTAHTSKQDCMACHPVHDFSAKPIDCAECHRDIEAELSGTMKEDCSVCHSDHRWKPGRDACLDCHDPLPATHSGGDYFKCMDCHPSHGFAATQ